MNLASHRDARKLHNYCYPYTVLQRTLFRALFPASGGTGFTISQVTSVSTKATLETAAL
ncbi:Uncharacterized protein CTYZ_00002856 [Cryptosporidium tyzzeri]|nr:Uncharacterized protein CTYZ_00002856 [Cryptosporidium tyzzeri]